MDLSLDDLYLQLDIPPPGNPDDGICTVREAIEKANYWSSTDNPDPNMPFPDCTPNGSDPSRPNEVIVNLYPTTYTLYYPLPPISGSVYVKTDEVNYPNSFATIVRSDIVTEKFRIFEITSGQGASLTLENIIVRNGYVEGNGGGILNAGTLTLINSAVIGNYAEGSGGGIYNTGTAAITGSCITGNTSLNGTSVHSTVSMTATNNWWGAADGPSGAGLSLSGDSTDENVLWEPASNFPRTGSGVPCDTNPPPPLPECTELLNLYANGFNPNINNSSQLFSTYLINPNTPALMRESCWRLYENIIFMVSYHELSDDSYLSWDEFSELNNQIFAPALNQPNERLILSIETSPFVAFAASDVWEERWNHRYLFARTMINGMIFGYIDENIDPMRYFAANYNETMSKNWMVSASYCGGTTLTELTGLSDSCLLRDWYSSIMTGYPNSSIYNSYIQVIRQAIRDEIAGAADPTQDALTVRPANARWDCAVASQGLGPNNASNHEAYVFNTHLGGIVYLAWAWVNEAPPNNPNCDIGNDNNNDNDREWYPTGIWKNDVTPARLAEVNELPNYCARINETLPQSYMRHLLSIFNSTAQTDLITGQGRNTYSSLDARFGTGYGPQGGRAAHAHLISPTIDGSEITYLRWYTFVFTRPRRNNEERGSSPIWESEYIVRQDNTLVTTTESSQVLQPIGCQ